MKRILLILTCVLLFRHFSKAIYVSGTPTQTKTKSALGMKTLTWQTPETTSEPIVVYQNYTNVKIQQHVNDDNLKQVYMNNNYNNYDQQRNNEQFDLEPGASSGYTRKYTKSPGGDGYFESTPTKTLISYPHGREQHNVFALSNNPPQNEPLVTCTVNCQRNDQNQPGDQSINGGTSYWAPSYSGGGNRYPQQPETSNSDSGYGGITISGTPFQPNRGYQPSQVPTFSQNHYNVIIPQNYYSGKVQNVPRQTRPTSKCPQGATGQFPYENSCNQFLNCWNGRGVVQNCAPGTLFNPETLECDFPDKVNCVSGPRTARYEKLTVKEKASCPSGFSGIVPHYQDCSKFLNCDHGRQVEMNCPPGTLFDMESNVCDHAYKVQCVNQEKKPVRFIESGRYVQAPPSYGQGGRGNRFDDQGTGSEGQNVYTNQFGGNPGNPGNPVTHGTGGSPKCPPQFSGLMPHPTDCSKFLNCGSGMTHIMDCGPGTLFSPSLKVCDHIRNVQCGSGGSGGQNFGGTEGQYGYNQNLGNHEQIPAGSTTNGQWTSQNQNWGQSQPNYNQWGQNPNQNTFSTSRPTWGQPSYQPSNSNTNWNTFANSGHQQTPSQPPSHPSNPLNPVYQSVNNWGQTGHYTSSPQGQTQTNDDDLDQKIQQLWQIEPSSEGTTPRYETLTTAYTENKRKPWPPKFPSGNTNNDYVFEDYDLVEVDPKKVNIPSKPLNQNGAPSQPNNQGNHIQVQCTNQTYNCGNNYCIIPTSICNGKKDCPNGFDEQDCSLRLQDFVKTSGTKLAVKETMKIPNVTLAWCAASCAKINCKGFNFRKHDGTCYILDSNVGTSGALIILPMYDYFENQKYTISCEQINGYLCNNQKCISKQRVCDGINDCGDGMDEKGCTADAFNYKLRLVGGENKHSGRLELQVFGRTGYICDDMFGLKNADVACRELGYTLGAAEVRGNSHFAPDVADNDTLYLMDDVVCLGNETSLRDCDFNGWGHSNCKPQEIVGVICKTPVEICPKDYWQCKNNLECLPLAFVCDGVYDCSDKSDEQSELCDAPIKLRLTQGTKGRLEIMHNGIWGTVCDDDFNDDAAKVVCNQLGYHGSAKVIKDGEFGPGTGPIWLDQVFCRGNETLLEDCIHWDWGEHNCEHSEDVGVICNTKTLPGTERHQHNLNQNIKPKVDDSKLPETCGFRNDAIFTNQDDPEDAHFRVVMAGTARAGEYPWQASIRVKGKTKSAHWCGAIVVSSKYVLTAAHCLTGFTKGAYFVVAGDYNVDTDEGTEQESYIEDFITHPKFGHGNKMNNDIALVRLKGKGFNITKDVQPVCLPPADSEYPVGLNCTISGFGSIESGKSKASRDLRAGWIPILSKEVCKMPHVYGAAITDGMLCAGFMQNGVDACDGDSGGPLACLHEGVFKLFGITSWGQHCGYANKPGVYVNVAKYRTWIEETMKHLSN